MTLTDQVKVALYMLADEGVITPERCCEATGRYQRETHDYRDYTCRDQGKECRVRFVTAWGDGPAATEPKEN